MARFQSFTLAKPAALISASKVLPSGVWSTKSCRFSYCSRSEFVYFSRASEIAVERPLGDVGRQFDRFDDGNFAEAQFLVGRVAVILAGVCGGSGSASVVGAVLGRRCGRRLAAGRGCRRLAAWLCGRLACRRPCAAPRRNLQRRCGLRHDDGPGRQRRMLQRRPGRQQTAANAKAVMRSVRAVICMFPDRSDIYAMACTGERGDFDGRRCVLRGYQVT